MKPQPKSIKLIALLLSVLVLLQGCNIYQKTPTTLESAVLYAKPVKVVSVKSEKFKFKWLEKEEGGIFGVANRKSKTSKILVNQIVQELNNGRFVKIRLDENQVYKIFPVDVTASTVYTVVIASFLAVGIVVGGLYWALMSSSWN